MKKVRIDGPTKTEYLMDVLSLSYSGNLVVITTETKTIIHSNGQHRYVYTVEDQ